MPTLQRFSIRDIRTRHNMVRTVRGLLGVPNVYRTHRLLFMEDAPGGRNAEERLASGVDNVGKENTL